MKAIVRERYGPPDVLEVREVERPAPDDNQVLVRVHATSVNPQDWHTMTGTPYLIRLGNGLRRPKDVRLGVDLAGRVEAVGAGVTAFEPGDEVFGMRDGAFAEYVCVRHDRVVPKPANVSFEQAASVPVAGLTALQGLRDKGGVRSGHRVLINGAGGGVGTFAVQVAKALGAEVTGVCSTGVVDTVRSLGADRVIDYTREDFIRDDVTYDVIFDVAGSRPLSDCARLLGPQGTLVVVGGPKKNRLYGPGGRALAAVLRSRLGRGRMVPMLASGRHEDLLALRDLLATGQVTPMVERTYPFAELPEAMRYLGEGHARGKLVITV